MYNTYQSPRAPWPYLGASNQLTGISRIQVIGMNTHIDAASAPEDVWDGSAIGVLNGWDHKIIPVPQTAVAMEVVSSSANDTAAGSGARTLVVQYLTTDYVAATSIITLNGLTPVSMPVNVLRINLVSVLTTGTYRASNVGNISIRDTGGLGKTYGYMLAGQGLSKSSLFTVPTGKTLDVLMIYASINRTDTQDRWAEFSTKLMYENGRLITGLDWGVSSTILYRHEMSGAPLTVIPEKTDIWVSCDSVSNNSTSVTAGGNGILR